MQNFSFLIAEMAKIENISFRPNMLILLMYYFLLEDTPRPDYLLPVCQVCLYPVLQMALPSLAPKRECLLKERMGATTDVKVSSFHFYSLVFQYVSL